MQLEGAYDSASKTYTVRSTVVNEAVHEIKQRTVTRWVDASRKKVDISWILEECGEQREVKIMEMTATRRN